MLNKTGEGNNRVTFTPQVKNFIKNGALTALCIGAVAGGALALFMSIPHLLPGHINVYHFVSHYGYKYLLPIPPTTFTVLGVSAKTLIQSAFIVGIASGVIGLGLYGLFGQVKKILNVINEKLENELLESNGDEVKEGNALKKNARDLVEFTHKTTEYFQYVSNIKLGRLVKTAAIIGAFTGGVVLLSLASYYYVSLLASGVTVQGSFLVYERSAQLALAALVIGGAISPVAGLLLAKEGFAKKKKKVLPMEAVNTPKKWQLKLEGAKRD